MEKPDTSRALRQIAVTMRRQALETVQPDYQAMMNRVAATLDAEAELIAEQHSQDFSRALGSFCASQLTSRLH